MKTKRKKSPEKGTCEWSDEGADMCGCPVSFFDPDAPLSQFCAIHATEWERLNNAKLVEFAS